LKVRKMEIQYRVLKDAHICHDDILKSKDIRKKRFSVMAVSEGEGHGNRTGKTGSTQADVTCQYSSSGIE
jgi:uncharacterized protein YwlG (UPF0340 family)